jgi:protein-tyrosine phosphatase
MDWTQITDQIWLGGGFGAARWQELRDRGVTACLSLQLERMDDFGSDPPTAYLWLPTLDGTAPTMAQLRLAVEFVHRCVSSGEVVLIHCAAGMGRAPTACAAYLIRHQGFSARDAVALLEERRPWVSPTGSQRGRLLEFERECRLADR